MKTCTKCKQEKNIDDFYNHASNKDGKQGQCKTCMRLMIRSNRQGKGVKAQVKEHGYSTLRFCKECKETKDWRRYYADQGMCTECWRKRLSSLALASDDSNKNTDGIADILTWIQKQCRTNSD